MKKLLYVCLTALFLSGIIGIANAEELSYKDAKKNIGKEVTICGVIVDRIDIPGPLLGMGVSINDSNTVGIEIDASLAGKVPKDSYIGKTLCVTGKPYTNPLGGASVKVTDMKQIVVK
jgi:hypothetical protein